jgi:hypothetical protein
MGEPKFRLELRTVWEILSGRHDSRSAAYLWQKERESNIMSGDSSRGSVNHIFKVAGEQIQLSADQVVERLKGEAPGPIQAHAVEVSGVSYSVKEAFAKATGLDVLDFNTNQARSILRKLGFKVDRVK